MKTYILPCFEKIDWSCCEAQTIDQCIWSPNAAPAATVHGLYLKDEAIVFRLMSSAAPSRAENTEPDSAVWEDSCLEVFFSFDGKNYVNLEANANAALRASFGPDRHDRKFLREMGIAMPTVQASQSADAWEIVVNIPIAAIDALWGKLPQSGDSFSANFFSCGDKTPMPHYAAWNKIETESPDFHRPEFFGKIIIG